jgi:murein DD-endopeptidase MepM/ murein hydrolase activator NlpD
MKKAYTKKKDKYITFMLVSSPDKEVKKIRLNKALLKSTAIFTAILMSYSVAATTGYIYLNNNHNVALERIEYLTEDNARQQREIASLYNYSNQVRNKMENLIKFDGQVRNMVGLRDQSSKRLEEFKGVLVASRGGMDRVTGAVIDEVMSESTTPAVMMSSMNQLNDSINILSSQMDIQKEELEKLLNDVDARLAYLEARPSFLPVYGRITSRFGGRKHPFSKQYQFHEGVDIATSSGTPIKATGKGVVVFSGWQGGYGKVIIISHGYGIKTRYAHNSVNLVKVGDRVNKGQIIGKVGSTGQSTGPHVHFEIEVNGRVVDPLKFIKGDK